MTDNHLYYGSGLEQSEYWKRVATLQDFNVIENDWKTLFLWALSVGRDITYFNDKNKKVVGMGISNLWDNQIFTVLVEIAQKNIESYKSTFIQDEGTIKQDKYTLDLENKIRGWVKRIDKFLNIKLQSGSLANANLSVEVAQTIKKQLKLSLHSLNQQHNSSTVTHSKTDASNVDDTAIHHYYNMLSVVKEIGQKCDLHIKQIEESGDMDPSLALLLTFIRNYSSIVDRLNNLIPTLSPFYRDTILNGRHKAALPDVTQLVITPANTDSSFYIPKGTAFIAGKNADGTDLLYRAITSRKISNLSLSNAYSIYLNREAGDDTDVISIQEKFIDCSETDKITPFFTDDQDSHSTTCGWMVESPMFLLSEGEREVNICMSLTNESVNELKLFGLGKTSLNDSFTLLLSNEDGWSELKPLVEYTLQQQELRFSFKLEKEAPPATSCLREIHKYSTCYPAIRLLLKNGKMFPYNWAILAEFRAITIKVKVDGIRNVSIHNGAGELDATVPFYPFGVQAKRGAWFVVGSSEAGIKPLTNVSLKGIWNQLPYGRGGFNEIYKNYQQASQITNQSFKVKTEWKGSKAWHKNRESSQELFQQSSNGLIDENCKINFTINKDYASLFRVTLSSPPVGFGTDEYQQLFAKIMMYNSKHKTNRGLPLPPIVPVLSDIELSYEAEHTVVLDQITESEKTLLYRITALSHRRSYPIKACECQRLATKVRNNHNLLLGIDNAIGETSCCIYFDLVPYKMDIFENCISISEKRPILSCKYYSENKWEVITISDETNGLTQSGYIKFTFPEPISETKLDRRGCLWLMINVKGDINQCLALHSAYLNCITVESDGGDGSSLPSGSIKESFEELPFVKAILQPFSGIKGRVKEEDERLAVRLSSRSATRNRAVTPSDYEQLIIERFPEIEKVYCIPRGGKYNPSSVVIVVLSRMQDKLYPSTPVWLLAEIKKYLMQYTSPWVDIDVINPMYEELKIKCEFIPRKGENIGAVVLRMNKQINNYFTPWRKSCTLPKINQSYSHKGLYTILANDEGIDKLKELFVNGVEIMDIDFNKEDSYIRGKYIWSILVPTDSNTIQGRVFGIGIGSAIIGDNFIIG